LIYRVIGCAARPGSRLLPSGRRPATGFGDQADQLAVENRQAVHPDITSLPSRGLVYWAVKM